MIAIRVTSDMHYHMVASPDYLARGGRPRTPADLQGHNCIRYRLPGGGFIPWLFVVDGKTVEFDVSLDGIGVAYLYEEYVAALVADGRLVSLLDKSALPITDGFFLFYQSRRQNSAALRALIAFLRSDRRIRARAAEAVPIAAS
jgi:DNA-binding transcriptional LysR family regulator